MNTTAMIDVHRAASWYREPYVWLLILFPAIAVVGGFVTLDLAIVSDDGLVTDDYYRKGLEINQVLKRDERAGALGLEADITLDQMAHTLALRLRGNDRFQPPVSLRLKLMHATRAGFDRDLVIESTAGGEYRAPLPRLAPGHWYAQIETDDWRILKSLSVSGAAR